MQVENFIGRVADFFDALVPKASDDELFASGYLRGHVDLAIGQRQVAEQAFALNELKADIDQSLQQAIANGELNAQDQQLVLGLWAQVQQLS
ncbi:YfcL family protein [Rheinheimera sp.]|uniref:YfcL family protein n=1 Tax=Rheinheimera sp. TaxID=1869214 RepID=UPI00307E4CD3